MGWAELRAMRTNRWKYIRAPKPELYDLVQDPGETTNVIASHPAEVKELEASLNGVSGSPEKVAPAAMDPRTLRQLKSLGYLGGSSTPGTELTGQGTDPKDRLEVLRLLHLADALRRPPARAYLPAAPGDRERPGQSRPLQQSRQSVRGSRTPAEAMKLYDDALSQGRPRRLAVLPPGQSVSAAGKEDGGDHSFRDRDATQSLGLREPGEPGGGLSSGRQARRSPSALSTRF